MRRAVKSVSLFKYLSIMSKTSLEPTDLWIEIVGFTTPNLTGAIKASAALTNSVIE